MTAHQPHTRAMSQLVEEYGARVILEALAEYGERELRSAAQILLEDCDDGRYDDEDDTDSGVTLGLEPRL